MTLPSRISPMARTWSGMEIMEFFVACQISCFFGGGKCWGWKPPWWEACWWIILEVQSPNLLNMRFSIFGGCDWEGETWQLSYQATLKTVFLPRFRNPKLWNGQSFGDAMKPLLWLTTWNHTNQLGRLGSIQTINVKSNWVSPCSLILFWIYCDPKWDHLSP